MRQNAQNDEGGVPAGKQYRRNQERHKEQWVASRRSRQHVRSIVVLHGRRGLCLLGISVCRFSKSRRTLQ